MVEISDKARICTFPFLHFRRFIRFHLNPPDKPGGFRDFTKIELCPDKSIIIRPDDKGTL
jgi:hypothetical protein